ncbi:putative MATE family efflux protein [Paenibacillus endophyticus]|uniref:Multidrug export protein MepA n=1 Tax=Paenibacillus endophyticus TaxID=1294268 RepID=A0A7W5C4H4_9BACL|nr:MATE family efflux transporter [Paenibacillus endophyticus]MBB3151055.1 putative MATE family efflux protein [Paenibacillus endophyticus]
MNDQHSLNPLDNQSVGRSFLKYLIPSMLGMLLVALNITIDGIMVGNKLGSTALAGIGIASPVYTLFVAMSLWVGLGGATLYSQNMGAKDTRQARTAFSYSLTIIFIATLAIGVTSFVFRDALVYALGANAETYPFASDYLNVMLLFGFVFTIENALSVFVRNDGNPNLAMMAQITFALSNVVINFFVLYVLDLGVGGVAYGTILAAFLGLMVLLSHFFKKTNRLKLIRIRWNKKIVLAIIIIGFPSFLSEVGLSVFTISHNRTLEAIAGTDGVSAFALLNYVHSTVLLTFLGMGSAIQPLISYYHGAKQEEKKRRTIRIATATALGAGAVLLSIMQLAAMPIISLFGNFSDSVTEHAENGLRIFVMAYLFMGINFVMMTFYQSIGNVKMAVWITAAREMILMLIFIVVLPRFLGVNGVWLSVPLAECIVLMTIVIYYKKQAIRERVLPMNS